MEVSVSPDPKDPTAQGSVALVKNGFENIPIPICSTLYIFYVFLSTSYS
jgi:hypothetical protein